MTHDDAVVERVRAARQKIVDRCGGDGHRILEWARRLEAENRTRVVRYESTAGNRRGRGFGQDPQSAPNPP